MLLFSLSALRKNIDLSLDKVAEHVGRSRSTIAKYEKDSSKIPADLLEDLSNLYQVPTDYIFLGKKYDLIRTIEMNRAHKLLKERKSKQTA